MTRIIRVIAAVVLCAGAAAIGAAQVPSRTDAPTTGTAQMRGRVFDAAAGKPLRRAQIRLTSADFRQNFLTASDDQGRYEFKDLPAGRYSLNVSKGGYVTLSYGQTRPFESGRPIELHDGQIVEKVDFSLPRGAVITGRLVDEFGDPVPNVQVTAMRYTFVQGQKRLSPTGGADTTNDLGEFRLFGLPPGQFYICGTSRPNLPLGPVDDDRAGYAPTYYPGVTNPSEAQRLTIGLGQARPDVNFALVPTRTARVTGTLVDSGGRPIANAAVTVYQLNSSLFMTQSAMVRPDGTFVINGLTPGEYHLRAQGPPARDGSRDIAMTQITVASEDIVDLRLVADAPVAISGRVVLDPAPTASLAPSAFRVSTMSMPTGTMTISFSMSSGQVQDDWTFATKATPGRNRMSITTPTGWSMKAVRLNGADVTDTGIDFKRNQEVRNIEIEVTNHPATLSGTVTNNRGDVPPDYTVVVFSRDEQRWTPGTRYIMTARPDQDGKFKVSSAPPGDYLAAALEYIEPGQSGDPDFLKQIRDRATAFSLGDGEAKALTLKLIAQP